jgi:Glyoxalase-like domain
MATVSSEERVRIGSIVIDCDDFPRMMAFWQEALGYTPRSPASDGWVVLKDPNGRGPNVSLNRTSEGPLGPYRLHLDLYTNDPVGELRRLMERGATFEPTTGRPERDFEMLRDPDGNLFCVIDTRPDSPGRGFAPSA